MYTNNRKGTVRFSKRKIIAIVLLYLVALGLCILLSWLFLGVAARVICSVDLEAALRIPVATFCCAAGILIISWLFLRKIGTNGLVWGGLLALGTWSVFTVSGMLQGNTFTTLSAVRIALYLCCGMFGGVVGVRMHERRKKKRPA